MKPDERATTESQLRIHEGLLEALDRREEVFDIVCSSDTPDEAEQRLRGLLRVSDPQIGRAVLDLQVGRWTRSERERILQRAEELRQALAASD